VRFLYGKTLKGVQTTIWRSWGELGALHLKPGDVITPADVAIYNLHLDTLREALLLLGMLKPKRTAGPSKRVI
jgi:hypothetical protein